MAPRPYVVYVDKEITMRSLIACVIVVAAGTMLGLSTIGTKPVVNPAAGERCSEPSLNVEALREAGPAGLHEALARYDENPTASMQSEIDVIAGQKDAVWSRLYWYTDLEKAQSAARTEGKPILYLRLLGNLTDEYSCANSRFFRTVLYANEKVSAMLRDQFVLIWESERPVPVVTIDYGDGRVLKRTITGNSVHYVLDSEGRVVDALPGLFDPSTFMDVVGQAALAATESSPKKQRSYQQRAEMQLASKWDEHVATLATAELLASTSKAAAPEPDATAAMNRTASKSGVEMPLLRAVSPQRELLVDASAPSAGNEQFKAAAALRADGSNLDRNSIELIRSQNPSALADPSALQRTVQKFEELLAADTLQNNYQLRRQVLRWLLDAEKPIELAALNTRVYSELFLTPREDPWLGLVTEGTYSALTGDGCGAR